MSIPSQRRSSYASVAAGAAGAPRYPPSDYTSRAGAFPRLIPAHASSHHYGQPSAFDSHTASYPPYHSQSGPQDIIRQTPSHISDFSFKHSSDTTMAHGHSYHPYHSYGRHGDQPPPFIRPPYLQGTTYMARLEEARERREREAASNRTPPNHRSLSTRSSSASLRPSHRGMTHEIIETFHAPEDDPLAPSSLPTQLKELDPAGNCSIEHGVQMRYHGTSKVHELEASAARADLPMPAEAGLYYFEVHIQSKAKEGIVAVGFSQQGAQLTRLPGWEETSWGYHSDDGKTFCCQLQGKSYGPPFGADDVIGCGVNFGTGQAFFTRNGYHLGTAFRDIAESKIYPSVGMKKPGGTLRVNFGDKPFMYDIEGHMHREENRIRDEINAQGQQILQQRSKMDEGQMLKQVVAEFLQHEGYIKTAREFAEEVREEESTLFRGAPAQVRTIDIKEDSGANGRHVIRTSILDGDIDQAVSLISQQYPRVFELYPKIYFKLRCRKFIEMMRQASGPPSSQISLYGNGKSAQSANASSEDVFGQAMELDDGPLQDGSSAANASRTDSYGRDHMQMETAESSVHAQQQLEVAIQYATELQAEYKNDPDKSVKEMLLDIFSLFAYPDPTTSPAAHLMDPAARLPVAEEVNKAILESEGKTSRSQLETIFAETQALIHEISIPLGRGQFVNLAAWNKFPS